MKGIKNIIFDLGGVVVDLDIQSSLAAFSRLTNRPMHTEQEAATALRPLMHAMDRGEMDAHTFVQIIKGHCHPEVKNQQIVDAFNLIIRQPRCRLEWIRELKKRYRIMLLSNIGDLHWQETLRQFAGHGFAPEDCFDDLFLSYRLQMAKPDPKIFRHLIQATGIKPEETLYIDDLPDNIEVGKAHGLVAYQIATNTLNDTLPKLFPELSV